MDLKKVIRTSTANMSKEEWLQFRQPITHIVKFIGQKFPEFLLEGAFDKPNKNSYNKLISFFKSQEWDDFIFPCIGASEMAAVLGMNKWKSSVELFYEKVGIKPPFVEENSAMFWGTHLEEQIAEKWQYWDGNPEGMILNYSQQNIIRKCRKVNFYIQPVDAPWIFVSLDRLINKQNGNKEGVLECKTIAGYYAQQWESGTPIEYIVQIMTQMGACSLDYGELAILIDGREMNVLPFDLKESIYENVVAKSMVFFERVKKAISYQICSKLCDNELMKKRFVAGIDSLSPDPDGSVSYESYLKETFVEEGLEKVGDDIDLKFAQRHEILKSNMRLISEQVRLCKNFLKKQMQGYVAMNFGHLDPGRVTYRKNKNGIRLFKIHVKVDNLDLQTLEEMIKAAPNKNEEFEPKFNLP